MPRLSPPSLLYLRRRLARRASAARFAEAVAAQLAHPPGASGDAAAERAAVDRVVRLLALGAAGSARPDEEAALLADPRLLSAVFQNLDLLAPPGSSPADGVARLLARLVERAETGG